MLHTIHIMGAAGSGKSTLASAIADKLGFGHVDTDDFYWLPTDVPYQKKRPVSERVTLLLEAISHNQNLVISGSLSGWGDDAIGRFDGVVWLDTPVEIRLDRLRKRQQERDKRVPSDPKSRESESFFMWAAAYDSGTQPGRSRPRDKAWIENLQIPVLHLDGSLDLAHQIQQVTQWMEQ